MKRGRGSVVVVGAGRLGGALASKLKRAGWSVSVWAHSASSARRVRQLRLSRATRESLAQAELCFLAVPDPEISTAAQALRPALPPTAALVHCAGALGLQALKGWPFAKGSFHPLMAISDSCDSWEGHAVALAASNKALMSRLRQMAADLRLFPIQVPERTRALYHAGAVLGAGCLVGLASTASSVLVRSGLGSDEAVRALLPLMRSALTGIERRGLALAVTGPVPRGDATTVARHLSVLPRSARDIYRELSWAMLRLVKNQPKARRKWVQVLGPQNRRRPCPKKSNPKRRSSKGTRAVERAKRLVALKAESERALRDQIRRLLALPPEKRTHFLRVRLPGGGSPL